MDTPNPKQLAKEENKSLATIYRQYPCDHPCICSADVRILINLHFSVREIAALLGISKSMVERYAKQ